MVRIEPGWHLVADRRAFTHHGIYVGRGSVIHFTGQPNNKRGAAIRRTSLADFVAGSPLYVRSYDADEVDLNSPGEACATAERLLQLSNSGKHAKYHLLNNNCEHLATFCKIGTAESAQVRDATGLAVSLPLIAMAANPVAGALGWLLGRRANRPPWQDERLIDYHAG
ncbi:lecithin retinol acyltransferase family protein [Dactylosporangium vinaceum]|uniref:Lecithin retinol acyltransferase family protein n=1 Tax=Dactylosporangium vinaceum TaxID=53362 RepID=A0ABV5MDP7_9ACTN|nr:lecithin retinol acyltransferase family protein [Dactylosporangium vinaceum]UAC01099.1 lecithin retinol acyltransferase family protein [Dactylosporangium vinaceum]